MSFQAHLLDPLFRTGKWVAANTSVDFARRANRTQLKILGLLRRTPLGYHISKVTLGGVSCEWVWKNESFPSDAVIVLLHGGGFIAGSAASHREIAWRLCGYSGLPVISVNYRLAPEFTYPAQVDDVMAVYTALQDSGYNKIGLAGDSAGGNLALVAIAECQRRFISLPSAVACLSPWADLTHSGDSIQRNGRREAVIAPSRLDAIAAQYRGDADAANPGVSPLFSNYVGYPPLQLHAMSSEILLDDTLRIAETARQAGVSVDCHIWNHAPHAAPLFADTLPEGRKILRLCAQFFIRYLSAEVTDVPVEDTAELLLSKIAVTS